MLVATSGTFLRDKVKPLSLFTLLTAHIRKLSSGQSQVHTRGSWVGTSCFCRATWLSLLEPLKREVEFLSPKGPWRNRLPLPPYFHCPRRISSWGMLTSPTPNLGRGQGSPFQVFPLPPSLKLNSFKILQVVKTIKAITLKRSRMLAFKGV